MIHLVDESLERLLRAQLPLPTDVGDVVFEVPDKAWAARTSRLTINAFLFDVGRSKAYPSTPTVRRFATDGATEVRDPLPSVRLIYLMTAWASTPRDEHELLGDLTSVVLRNPVLPAEHVDPAIPGPVLLSMAEREGRKPGELWSAMDGRMRPGLELAVDLLLPVTGWRTVPVVTSAEGVASAVPPRPSALQQQQEAAAARQAAKEAAHGGTPTHRRSSGRVLIEGRPGTTSATTEKA